MADTSHEEDEVWLHNVTYQQHEDLQVWDQWQQNYWTHYGTTYGDDSGIGSSGDESTIITMIENMRVQQKERQQEELCRHDAFEADQEECLN